MRIKNKKKKDNSLANFLFEASTLKRLKRTGWQILGGNEESIAEHSFMVTVISYILAVTLGADVEKILLMALFHDFAEIRTGDIYKLADLYVSVDEEKAEMDAFANLANGQEIVKALTELKRGKSIEAKIVHDADTLAFCLELKRMIESGNPHAKQWFEANRDRIRLEEAKKLMEDIQNTDSQNWWKKEREMIHQTYKNR